MPADRNPWPRSKGRPGSALQTNVRPLGGLVDAELDTLATALYVKIDDALKDNPGLAPRRPVVGICPKLSDAELLTLCVLQALGGFVSDARFLRHARAHLLGAFPYLPNQPGYNKRVRKAIPQLKAMIRLLACATDTFFDDLWVIDSTPVECGRSRPTARRSDLAGFAGYGYCASHSRWFWGLRLHLICTSSGLPVAFALANAKADEREVARDMLEIDAHLLAGRPGQKIMGDKGYASGEFEAFLAEDRKSTRLNSSHSQISYAVFCLKKKKERPARQSPVLHR